MRPTIQNLVPWIFVFAICRPVVWLAKDYRNFPVIVDFDSFGWYARSRGGTNGTRHLSLLKTQLTFCHLNIRSKSNPSSRERRAVLIATVKAVDVLCHRKQCF